MSGSWAPSSAVCALVLAGLAGCDSAAPEPAAIAPTASSTRAARRLYDGAPPVIPHRPLNIGCVQCHTDTGKESPPLGFAPANPHARTAGLSSTSNCQQCHAFRRLHAVFAESDFAGLAQRLAKGDRLYQGAPPVIPHRVFMRENCTSCHSGPAVRPEIRCTHPHRANCRQCHVPVAVRSDGPSLARPGTAAVD
jgi:cytochrome c-type protein NapB